MKETYLLDVDGAESALASDLKRGLTSEEAARRAAVHGKNELTAKKRRSPVLIFLSQFKDFMVVILLLSAAVSAAAEIYGGHSVADSLIITFIVVLNAAIGTAQELKADKTLSALRGLNVRAAKVTRDGRDCVIAAADLTPGDIVEVEAGDYVPADLRLSEVRSLKVSESALTGESLPVEKITAPLTGTDIPLGDRANMLFSGSLVTYGRGRGIVAAVGMNTETGKIANLLNSAETGDTPLQKKLNALGKILGITALGIVFIMFAVGVLIYRHDVLGMFMTAVSLAVAAIPEGLPAVATVVLAIGTQKMSKKNAIVRLLPAVESLGSATVICSDKTGTLTQNKMEVKRLYFDGRAALAEDVKSGGSESLRHLILASALCNDAKFDAEKSEYTGDPTETALLALARRFYDNKTLSDEYPREDETPFDSDRKLMSTVHKRRGGGSYVTYVKGGVDELLARCTHILTGGGTEILTDEKKRSILSENQNMAASALRVLAFAFKTSEGKPFRDKTEEGLTFAGLAGMLDPPRPECAGAVKKCRAAGIKVYMITGDHLVTAKAIAEQLGILDGDYGAITGAELNKLSDGELKDTIDKYRVFARVSPEHKVKIVRALKSRGEVVAMTGDGVNDAPALKIADIGAAMGKVGTDVAKESADMILTDDNFATVVSAVEEGRRIYDNIVKAVQFLLSSNIGEIIVLFVAVMAGLPEPLLPIQLLWVNLVTDSLPAIGLAFDPAAPDVMSRPPEGSGKILTQGNTWRITYQGVMMGFLSLAAFFIGYRTGAGAGLETARTMAFSVLALSQLTHVFNVRNPARSAFKELGTNKKLLLCVAVSAAVMLAVLLIPALAPVFGAAALYNLSAYHLCAILFLIFVPVGIVEAFKVLGWNS